MALDAEHEQAISRPLSHDELVQLQRVARKRGSLLIWVDKDMTWRAPRDGRPGRPAVFSDAAIQFCSSIKDLFKLPLRQTAGMVASLLRLAGLDWPVRDFSTLCRRQKTLAVQVPYRRADGPLNLLVPSRDIAAQCPAGQWTAPGSSSSAMAPSHGLQANHCRVINGRLASTGCKVDANGARSIWPWTRPHLTSERWNSPPAATAPVGTLLAQCPVGQWTVLCCPTCSARSRQVSR